MQPHQGSEQWGSLVSEDLPERRHSVAKVTEAEMGDFAWESLRRVKSGRAPLARGSCLTLASAQWGVRQGND